MQVLRVRAAMVRGLVRWQRAMERARRPILAGCTVIIAAGAVIGFRYDPGSVQQVIAYKVVLFADLAAIYSYVGVYSVLQPWWSSRIGRSIVLKDVALSVPLLVIAGSLFFSFGQFTSKVGSAADLAALTAMAAILFARSDVWVAEHASKAGNAADEAGKVAALEAEVARLRGLLGQ